MKEKLSFMFWVCMVMILTIGNSVYGNVDSLKSLLNKEMHDSVRYDVLLNLSQTHYKSSDYLNAHKYCSEGLVKSVKNKDREIAVEFHRLKGKIYQSEGKIELAINSLREGIAILKETKQNVKTAETLKQLGLVYYRKGDLPGAIESFLQALDFLKTENEIMLQAKLYGNLGVMYEKSSRLDVALEYHKKALDEFEKEDKKLFVGMCFNNIGNLLTVQDQSENAKEYFEKALKIFLDLENDFQSSKGYVNLGMTHLYLNNLDTASYLIHKGIKLKEKLKDKSGLVTAYEKMGLVYEGKGNLKESLNWFNKAENLARIIKDNFNLVLILKDKSKIYLKQGRFLEGIACAEEGISLVTEINSLSNHANLLRYLSRNHQGLGNYKESLKYNILAEQLYDSVYTEEKTNTINNLHIQYQTEQKEKEIELLKKDAIIKKKESTLHKQQKYFAIFGAFVLLVLLILAGNRMKLRRNLFEQKEAKLKAEAKYREEEALRKEEELKATAEMNQLKAETVQNELEYRNREITSSALFVAQKNEILSTINDKLSELKDAIKTESKKEITQLKRLIKDNIELDDDWNNFKLHFEKVHPKFFETLSNQYHDLTANEQKICAYLRMNLSGKEIARLMNITPKSTQMSRYRLKKKFNLGADDDLIAFIGQI